MPRSTDPEEVKMLATTPPSMSPGPQLTATAAEGWESPPPPAHRPLRVLVAEDHPLFRRAVTRALAGRPQDFLLAAEVEDGEAALRLIDALEPDIALLDMRMPGLDGIEVCARVRQREPPPATKVVLLSAFDDPGLVSNAVAAGAAGYLDKRVSNEELCDALMRVGSGGIAYTQQTAAGLARRLEDVLA